MSAVLEIQVQVKSVYGQEQIYPICSKAKLFAGIAGTKTLTRGTIDQIKDLGYVVRVVPVVTTL